MIETALQNGRQHDLEAIAHQISQQTGVSLDEIASPSRMPVVSRARQDLVVRLRERHWTLQEIGAAIGGRHHTTVMYELRRAAERRRAERQETMAS